MSTKHQRRQGGHHAGPDAATEHQDHSTPSDVEALQALKTLRAWLGSGAAPSTYDQREGHLPPDAVSADAYKRRHRALRKADVEGVYVRGKLLVCSAEAWTSDIPRRARAPALTVVPVDPLDAALGIRSRGAG